MNNRRTIVVVLSIVAAILFLASCTQAYSSGQRAPETESPIMNQPVKSEPLVPTLEQIQYSFQQVAQEPLPVVVEINTVEDKGGDPERRQEACKAVYESAVEALVRHLKSLKPFGGSSTGS